MLLALVAFGIVMVTAPTAAAGTHTFPSELPARVDAPFPRAIAGVTIEKAPQRIVAASVLSAEVLLELVPKERIAGVHFLAAEPRYSRVAAQTSGLPLLGASPEQLVAARPDLVVVDEFTLAETPILLQSLGIPVVRTRAIADFADVADDIRLLGWVVGADAEAEAMCDRLAARAREIRSQGEGLAAWRVMNLNGALDTYGAQSLLDDAVRIAGATHLPAHHGVGGYRKLDIETVLAWRPDALIVSYEDGSEARAEWLHQHPGLRLLPCVQKGRVVHVPGSLLSNTSQHAIEVAAIVQQQLREWGTP